MKIRAAIVLNLALASCFAQSTDFEKIKTETALDYLKVARSIQKEEAVYEKDWDSLFSSSGYEKYFVYNNTKKAKNVIKEATYLVFDPSKKYKLDSTLAIPITMETNWQYLMLIQNIYRLSQKMDQATEFLKETDFESLFNKADELARKYLPASFESKPEALFDVFFVISDPDGKVNEGGIVVDLNTAITLSNDELIGLIAHEFHHNYRQLNTKDYEHPLMNEVNKIHQEGLADLIDKDVPPLDSLYFFPRSIIELYNHEYHQTPSRLETLQTKTLALIEGNMSDEEFESFVNYYFKFGGHPNGLYMALIIKEELGLDVLIESYNAPIEFLKLYNQALSKQGKKSQFSEAFLRYIETLN
ncbi:MAG: hypothetical protein Tsb0034_04260 [Ekhidna sp.]